MPVEGWGWFVLQYFDFLFKCLGVGCVKVFLGSVTARICGEC
jgi:hypothetical protein